MRSIHPLAHLQEPVSLCLPSGAWERGLLDLLRSLPTDCVISEGAILPIVSEMLTIRELGTFSQPCAGRIYPDQRSTVRH